MKTNNRNGSLLLRYLMPLLCFVAFELSLLCGLCYAGDTGIAGYNIHLLTPAFDNRGVLTIDGAAVLPHLKTSFQFINYYHYKPVYVINPANRRKIDIIKSSLGADVTAAVGLFNHFDVGLDIPVSYYQSGINYTNLNNYSTSSIGDIIFNIKYAPLKEGKHVLGLAAISKLYAPTGSRYKFTGNKNISWEGKLAVDKHIGPVYLAANVGYKIIDSLRLTTDIIDDMLTYGLGVEYTLPIRNKSWVIFAEFVGQSVTRKFSEATSPLIFRGGLKKSFKYGINITLGGDAGITDAIGSPKFGVFGGVSLDLGKKVKEIRAEIWHHYTKVYFPFDSSNVQSKYGPELNDAAAIVKEDINARIRITGYTDSVGSKSYNQKLSESRARAVSEILVRDGVNPSQIETKGYGELKPAASNRTVEGRRTNRRAIVEGTKDLGTLPGIRD